MSMLEFIREQLQGRSQAEWRVIADRAGIPYSTLEKIAYGLTENPRIGTVEPLYRLLKEGEFAKH